MERGSFFRREVAGVDVVVCHLADWPAIAMSLEDIERWTASAIPGSLVVAIRRAHDVTLAVQHGSGLVDRIHAAGLFGVGIDPLASRN